MAAPAPDECPPQISPPCVLCGGETFEMVIAEARDFVWRKPGRFGIQRCAGCGLVATRPRPSPEALPGYYADAYSGEGSVDTSPFYGGPVGRLLNRYRLVTIDKVRRLPEGTRLLDVGCGAGHLLQRAAEERGFVVSGLDLDEGSVAAARAAGLADCHVGAIDEAPWADGHFQVVSFYECLEHEEAPLAALRRAHALLEPGGLCVVEVPDFDSPLRRVFGPAWLPLLVPQHLQHFTADTLRHAFASAGFEVVHRQAMLFPMELAISAVIAVAAWTEVEPIEDDADKTVGYRLLELALLLLFLGLLFTVELPVQLLLRITGHAGHQTVIGQKPQVAPATAPPTA